MGHNIEQRAGGFTFVEIQRFCGICPKTFETDCSEPGISKEEAKKLKSQAASTVHQDVENCINVS
jgi:hypothetical protein